MDKELPLRDIHLPDPISAWPPAIGWWLLLLALIILAVAGWFLFKRLTRVTALKQAKTLLEQIKHETATDDLEKLQQLSTWLRRVAISVSPREDVASLSGQQWLTHLDSSLEGSPFSDEIGQQLISRQYQKSSANDINLSALFDRCETWLGAQK